MTAAAADPPTPDPATPGTGRPVARVAGWVGLALHLVVGVVPYAGSGLLAPDGAVAALWGLWALLLAAAIALLRVRPAAVPAVPVLAVGLWVLVMSVGDLALGWVA